MWCANCQAEVAAEVLDNNRTVLCANCQSELGSLRGASADERTRQARELLERWAQSGITDPLSPHARSRGAAAAADSSAPSPPAGDSAAEQAPPQQPASPDSPPAAAPSLDTETDSPAGTADESTSHVPAPGRATATDSAQAPVASTGGRRLRFDTAEHTREQQAVPPARSSVRTSPADSSPDSRQAPRQQIRFDQPHGEPSDTPAHRAPADPGPARTARDEREVSAEAPSEHPEHRTASPHSRRARHPEPETDYDEQPAPSEPAVRFHQPEHGPHSARRSRRQPQEPAYYADQTEEDDYQEQAPPYQPPYRTPHQRPPQQKPPEQVVRRVTSVRPRRPHFADVTEQRSRVHAPHAAAPQPHFDVQAFMEPAPETPANWLSIVGPVLAYLGVGLLTVGTVLVLWAWFGGPASYAPTGWLITTAGQMLLFLGIVTLVSGGMEQTTTEVRTRISHLGERILRMEHASRDHALRGPSIPSENFDPASRPARSRERARAAQPRRRRQ